MIAKLVLSRLEQLSPLSVIVRRANLRVNKLDTRIFGKWLLPFKSQHNFSLPEVHAITFTQDGYMDMPVIFTNHMERGVFLTNTATKPCEIHCLFGTQAQWDLGIYDFFSDNKEISLEFSPRVQNKSQKPLESFTTRALKATKVENNDKVSFLKALTKLLEYLLPTLKKKNLSSGLLVDILVEKQKLVFSHNDDAVSIQILQLSQFLQELQVGEKCQKLEELFQVTLESCKTSARTEVTEAFQGLVATFRD
eukprot:TRINITY_DN1244_c0_g1_i1.p1 TRINITY_DN1244_c0_g1~~TRINITY_DN1244_c0_g1_i1.p1  ORF type:complete len:251 (+),score=51.43 TRINITY_DN1244_c0_g1_i1:1000-1752(+)